MIFSPSENGHHAGTIPAVPIPPSCPIASINKVLAPSLAAEIAAVHPPGPPPITITSHRSSTAILVFFRRILDCGVSPFTLRAGTAKAALSSPAFLRKSLLDVITN